MAALNWAKFFAAVLPELSSLARALFQAHKGDADAAREELQSYGKRRREQQARLDAELAQIRRNGGML